MDSVMHRKDEDLTHLQMRVSDGAEAESAAPASACPLSLCRTRSRFLWCSLPPLSFSNSLSAVGFGQTVHERRRERADERMGETGEGLPFRESCRGRTSLVCHFISPLTHPQRQRFHTQNSLRLQSDVLLCLCKPKSHTQTHPHSHSRTSANRDGMQRRSPALSDGMCKRFILWLQHLTLWEPVRVCVCERERETEKGGVTGVWASRRGGGGCGRGGGGGLCFVCFSKAELCEKVQLVVFWLLNFNPGHDCLRCFLPV